MPWIMQMLGFGLLLLGIAVALWVSIWVLLIVAGIGIASVIWVRVKEFLLEKGILNPTPGIPPEPTDSERITIVDADFTNVDSKADPRE